LEASCTSGAAYLCDHLVEGLYIDWYLPSKDELNKLFLYRVEIGGLMDAFYWSSSELDALNAWFQLFGTGSPYASLKNYSHRVRAVRAF